MSNPGRKARRAAQRFQQRRLSPDGRIMGRGVAAPGSQRPSREIVIGDSVSASTARRRARAAARAANGG